MGCGGEADKTMGNGERKKGELVKTDGDRYYGGVFRINELEFLRSLYPLNITETVGGRIARSIYEG